VGTSDVAMKPASGSRSVFNMGPLPIELLSLTGAVPPQHD
jgi:hypothetical protein